MGGVAEPESTAAVGACPSEQRAVAIRRKKANATARGVTGRHARFRSNASNGVTLRSIQAAAEYYLKLLSFMLVWERAKSL
jgi:hypothetical protein